MKIIETALPGVLVFEPRVFADPRGYFLETWSAERYRAAGIERPFVQDNISFSSRGTLRGLHFQHPQGQGKLVQALTGQVFDVAVDVRRDSPQFGRWHGVLLGEETHNQMYIPPGFAHGFYVVSETAHFSYKCTDLYSPHTEHGLAWNDPEIGIDWPAAGVEPTLSSKDAQYGPLSQFARELWPSVQDYQ
jgi:dTDP-4-dehydrorhamnose 3,5-epimerase